jgi:hypothetical protein
LVESTRRRPIRRDELDPKYVDTTVLRWQVQPQHDLGRGVGRSFEEIAAGREAAAAQ